MNEKLRCPICTIEMINGEPKRYETLDDHVCNPNGHLPERETYVCKNTGCDAFRDQLFWDYEGGGSYNSAGRDYKYIDDNPCAIPSFQRKLYAEIYDKSQNSTILRTKRLLIERKARRVADEYGNILRQSYYHDFYYNDGKRGYCLWIPGYKMLIYCIRGFYRDCNLYGIGTESGRRTRANKILDHFRKFPRDEWWRKATRLWIKLFHGKLLKESIAISGRNLGNWQ